MLCTFRRDVVDITNTCLEKEENKTCEDLVTTSLIVIKELMDALEKEVATTLCYDINSR